MKYTTGVGQKMNVHDKGDCKGGYCTIHNPSMDWPTCWREEWEFMEYICPCGVGYPAPEDEGGNGHAFGTCGKGECWAKYKEACDKVNEAKEIV